MAPAAQRRRPPTRRQGGRGARGWRDLGQRGFQPLLPAAWINAWLGLKETDGTIQPASARGDGLWPPPADVLMVRTGHTFMAEKDEVIRQTAHFLAHGRFVRPAPSAA